MRKKFWVSLLVVAVIGVIPATEISTSTVAESHEISGEDLPESLRYDSLHPDVIYVKDYGVFEKVDSNLIDYGEAEVVVDDLQKITNKTNAIVANDETYIKKGEWK